MTDVCPGCGRVNVLNKLGTVNCPCGEWQFIVKRQVKLVSIKEPTTKEQEIERTKD